MSKRARWALLLVAVALFLVLNRAAYKGYFQDDDLDTMGWSWFTSTPFYLKSLVSPRLTTDNFRPVGHYYYHVMDRNFGLDFPKYLIPLHLAHLLNIWLLWMVARKLGLGVLAASAGAFFFGFHAVLFDAWWKPMYVFDVFCTTLCLASLLFYLYDRWILSLIAMWLAFKSKELAIMLPAVLLCYEYWLGKRRWKRLIPFFAVSLLFGIQALVMPARTNEYALQVKIAALVKTINYYSSQMFMLPFAGLAVIALPFLIRDRRLWFGLAAMFLFLFPLLLLPGRLYSVYWYLPLTGLAIALATIADGRYRIVIAVLFLIWIPWDFRHFREQRRAAQRMEWQYRTYVTSLQNYARSAPGQRLFVWDNVPEGFHHWGVGGAVSCVFRAQAVQVYQIDAPGAQGLIQRGEAAWLHWDPARAQLFVVRYPAEQQGVLLSYLPMEANTLATQLGAGWFLLEANFRWTQPKASATLLRPESAKEFELVANATELQIRAGGALRVEVLMDGKLIGRHEFVSPGWQTVHWSLPPGKPGPVSIEIQTDPPFHSGADPRILGVAVRAFGFIRR